MKSTRLLILIFCLAISSYAQKVGVVLSGGGGSAMAHVGVLLALEENNIPIDYITGTSMGAFVGGLYAAGYSPKEIAVMLTSETFRNQAYGNIDDRYVYYFKKKDDNASWITVKLALDSTIETSLPTNLVNPIPIDFALMLLTARASSASAYNFDSLMIPFRCLASDIELKQNVVFRKGDLGVAIRASISYPFYLKPIKVDGRLLFDGGIYNNFPSNIMYDEFYPDIIIGSNVSSNEPPPDEDNLISQMKTMLLTKTNFDVICQNGVIIEPNTSEIGTFNFDVIQTAIDSGYAAAMRKIGDIKKCMTREVTKEEIEKKRKQFRDKQKPLVFGDISVTGLKKNQAKYVEGLLRRKRKQLTLEKLEPAYFRMAADDKIKYLFPTAVYNTQTGMYDLRVNVKKEKDIVAQVGGNFSNRPINMGFLSLEYNYMGRLGMSISGNVYAGKLYASGQLKARFDFPLTFPFYIEPSITYNRWDFFKSSTAFFETARPPYLVQYESYGGVSMGLPLTNKSKLILNTGLANLTDDYYQTDQFTVLDTTDRTDFNAYTARITFEQNSLNRKQYANAGTYINATFRYVQGEEYYQRGSTSLQTNNFRKIHEWIVAKANLEHYFKTNIFYKPGVMLEGVYSSQTFFKNYTSSILASPAFQPLPECKTLFQEKYRTHKYMAIGLKNIFVIRKIFEIRLEGYYYQPYQTIVRASKLIPDYNTPLSDSYFLGTGAVLCHTPIGPVCASVNYYHGEDEPFTFLFHFGYILFNKKAFE